MNCPICDGICRVPIWDFIECNDSNHKFVYDLRNKSFHYIFFNEKRQRQLTISADEEGKGYLFFGKAEMGFNLNQVKMSELKDLTNRYLKLKAFT